MSCCLHCDILLARTSHYQFLSRAFLFHINNCYRLFGPNDMIGSIASDKEAPCTYSLFSLCHRVVNDLYTHLKKQQSLFRFIIIKFQLHSITFNYIHSSILNFKYNCNILPGVWGHGGPLHVFITGGRGISLHALPAGFLVPYQTHCKILYLIPSSSHDAVHYEQIVKYLFFKNFIFIFS